METKPISPPSESKKSRRIYTLVAAGLLVFFTMLCVTGMRDKSPNRDAGSHLGRGIAILKRGDFRLSVAHPPLGNVISALPLLALPNLDVPFDHFSWEGHHKDPFWQELFQRNRSMIGLGIFWSQLVTVGFSVLLGWLLYRCGREWFGLSAGLLALGLFVFDPNLLANAGQVATDLFVTLGVFAAVLTWVRFIRRPGKGSLLLAALMLGIANLTKFSAILLYPMHLLLLLGYPPAAPRLDPDHSPENGLPSSPPALSAAPLRKKLAAWMAASLLSALVIWAGYGFEVKRVTEPMIRYAPEMKPLVEKIPLPLATYLEGLLFTQTNLRSGISFFLGEVSRDGWWYFFPVLFVLKTPIPLLLLIAAAIPVLYRRGKRLELFILLTPVFVFFLAAMLYVRRDMGLRYLLPVYPFLYLLVAGLWREAFPKSPGRILIWAGLLLWYAARTLQVHPHYLMYFNEFAGGPEGGWRYSIVSDDFGQDIKGLARYLKEKGIGKIYYTPFGSATPGYYGIEYEPVPCSEDTVKGWVAINAYYLQIPRDWDHPDCHTWLKKYEPVDKIGYSIFLYYFP